MITYSVRISFELNRVFSALSVITISNFSLGFAAWLVQEFLIPNFFLLHHRTLARCLQFCLGRRQTRLIVAGTILHITVDVVLRFRETNLLHEGDGLLEETQLHVEEFVVLLDLLASGL